MSAFDERRLQDVEKLKELERQSHSRVKVVRISGSPANEIEAELHLKTAASDSYPSRVEPVTRLRISLAARYPFVEPTVTIHSPIFHPNVFTSGRICLGLKWLPSFGLDLLVRRVAQIITFDPTVVNVQSPANGAAATWYRQAVRSHPNAFPSDVLNLTEPPAAKTMSWSNAAPTAPARSAVACPHCAAKLALPRGRSGNVTCPKCGTSFMATA